MIMIYLTIAIALFFLTGMLFNISLFAAASDGRLCGARFWLLGLTCGLMAVVQLDLFLSGQNAPPIAIIGHLCLIAHAAACYRRGRQDHPTHWIAADRATKARG